MHFLIADRFSASLLRLTAEDQKFADRIRNDDIFAGSQCRPARSRRAAPVETGGWPGTDFQQPPVPCLQCAKPTVHRVLASHAAERDSWDGAVEPEPC
ncbi:MAG: hypothetical protein HZA67_13845 [Rhodospirillales bacterium]|nr:hypothetical protein [Rhodospirillales bacterium]